MTEDKIIYAILRTPADRYTRCLQRIAVLTGYNSLLKEQVATLELALLAAENKDPQLKIQPC